MSMLFTINNSPFFGKEGKFVTSRHLRDRLFKEMEKNLALRVEETATEDKFMVYGRGILHLSILVETMRREGYELQVGRPHVIFKEIDGKRCEPFEFLVIDVPQVSEGRVIELVTQRKGMLQVMEPKGDLKHLEFVIPSRGLIGLRNIMLTATAGEAIMTHRFKSYEPYAGEIASRTKGSLVSMENGMALTYAIDRLQDRGRFFVEAGEQVYKGQVIGEYTRDNDLEVNIIKGKKMTNMRAAGSDDNAKIVPKIVFSLEESMEYIKDDEYLEVTPRNLRMRKIG
jgi:GTP-binding protein